jgi:hypothetical protein
MNNWLDNNWDDILQKYPEAKPLLSYFMDSFSTCAGKDNFIDMIKLAIRKEGASIQEVADYSFTNDVTDDGERVDIVEFYFNEELDGTVPVKMFVEVFEIIALAYAEYNPEDKEQIIYFIPRLKQAYSI